jgi:predicted dehydrogenase
MLKIEYFPAVKANSNYALKAVYSRSEQSATKFGDEASTDAYYDTPETPDKSLNKLLGRSDIDAVIIALPITAQPDIIRAALKAGKHVLSEKPVAKDSTVAKQLIADYEPYKAKGQVWAVAENFRFIDPIAYGTEQLKRLGGEVTGFHVSVHDMVKNGNPYYDTEWYETFNFTPAYYSSCTNVIGTV